MLEYKGAVNKIMDSAAFWPVNTRYRQFLNLDDKNKVMVVERSSQEDTYVVVINISSWKHQNYKVGIKSGEEYEVVFNSDKLGYAGFGLISYPGVLRVEKSGNFELLDKEVNLSILAPYGVVVLRKIR